MEKQITISTSEYESLTSTKSLDHTVQSISILLGVIGLLTIFWKISLYVNVIKHDVCYVKEHLGSYMKKVNNINLFLVRKFEDYRHSEEDD